MHVCKKVKPSLLMGILPTIIFSSNVVVESKCPMDCFSKVQPTQREGFVAVWCSVKMSRNAM